MMSHNKESSVSQGKCDWLADLLAETSLKSPRANATNTNPARRTRGPRGDDNGGLEDTAPSPAQGDSITHGRSTPTASMADASHDFDNGMLHTPGALGAGSTRNTVVPNSVVVGARGVNDHSPVAGLSFISPDVSRQGTRGVDASREIAGVQDSRFDNWHSGSERFF